MSLQLVCAAAVQMSSTACCHPPLSPPVLVAAVPPFPRSAFFLAASAKPLACGAQCGAVPSGRRRSPLLSLSLVAVDPRRLVAAARRAAASRPRRQLWSLRRAGRGRGRAPCTPPKGTAIGGRRVGGLIKPKMGTFRASSNGPNWGLRDRHPRGGAPAHP